MNLTVDILATLSKRNYFKKRLKAILEPDIAKDGHTSYNYAHLILGKRFPEGEEAIAAGGYAAIYAHYVLRGPFPLGEYAIAVNTNNAYWYAVRELVGRFELGEVEIRKDYRYAEAYQKFLEEKGIKLPNGWGMNR